MKKALAIVDMVVRDVKNRKDKNKLINNQLILIKAFNDSKQIVIIIGGRKDGKYIRPKNKVMIKLWGDEESKNTRENKVIPELLNSDYNYYIDKGGYSAFFRTNFEKICKKEKINEIYFCGISSGVCVYFSAADAAMRGIQPFLVSDASGAPNEKAHRKNIKRFIDILGPALSTKEVLRRIK